MADVSTAVRRLQIETTVTGASDAASQLGRLNASYQDNATAAVAAQKAGVQYESQLAALQRQCDALARTQLAQNAALAANAAAQVTAANGMAAANDNATKSFASSGIEFATWANRLRGAGEAAYAFSPAFRGVVNGLAAPALSAASTVLTGVAAGIVTATNLAGAGMVRLGAAAASIAPSFPAVSTAIGSAGVAMQAFNPTITSVAGTIISKVLPAFRLLGAVTLIVDAARLVGEAWELGGQKLDEYRQIAEKAAAVDLSTTYFQKLTKGADDAKIPVDALTKALNTLQASSADQLGGSTLQNRLDASVKAGNFSDNSGVAQYAQANTTQQKYEAIVSLIHQAMDDGERLAALDIAKTAFGPDAAANLAKDSEYFDKLQESAAKISDTQIVSPDDVGRALDLQNRYDAAVTILEQRWHPVQDLLAQGGIQMHAQWVEIVELIAQGATALEKFASTMFDTDWKDITTAWSYIEKGANAAGTWITNNTTTPESRASAEAATGISSAPADIADTTQTKAYSDAVDKLRAGLQNQAAVQQKVNETNTIAQKTLGDTSHAIDTNAAELDVQRDAYDRARDAATKHYAQMNADSAAIGLGAGALAEFQTRASLTTAAILAQREMTPQLTAEIEAYAKAAGTAAEANERLKVNAQIKFQTDTAGLTPEDVQIAQQLKALYPNVADGLNSVEAAGIRANLQMKSMIDYANSFGQAFTQALASGKNGTDALSAAVGSIGSKLSSELMSKASTNVVAGVKSGDVSQIATGGLDAIAGIGISLLQGEAAKAKQAQADFKAAQDAWTGMAGEVTKFKDQMLGTNTGSLGGAITDATTQAQTYADAAHKAGQATGDLTSVLATYVQRMTRDFMNTFDATIEALNEGLGMDSPAVKAAANVKSVGDTLKGFIDDTVSAGQGLAQAGPAIAAASAASQSYALSLLQTPPVLTTVQTALLTLRGNAQQLQTTLQDLGMSAGDAGAAISTGIKAALAGISATFAQGLQEQINSASGKDYINQINALLTQGASNLSDAQSLGMDPTLVAQAFQTQAQAVIDSAGLVGSAFDDFITQFPELSGVVNQSTTAIKSLSDATTQFYANLKTTISTYLHNLNTGAQSALSPQDRLATAQTDYNTQLALAQGGNRDAIGSITQYSNDLLSAAKDYFASSTGYADVLKQVQTQLATLPDTAAANDPVVEQLKQVSTNTGNTVATLAALQAIQAATQSSSVNISASMTQLGAQGAYVAAAQGSQYFGPMNAYLSQIAVYTRLSGQAAAKPDSGSVWWNPFTWFAEGGSVTGGTPGKDSVMAMLTPNEFVVKPGPATDYLPLLQAMNAGMLPPLQHFANGGMVMPVSVQMPMISAAYGVSSGSAAGNDNGQHFSDLGNTLVRAITGAAMAEITSNKEEMAMLRAEIVALRRAVEGGKPKAAQAGTRMAS